MAQESPQKQATSPKQEENTEKILSASEAKKRFEELMKSQRPMRPLVPVLKPTAQVSIFTNSLKGV